MRRRLAGAMVALLPILALLVVATSQPGNTAAGRVGSLQVTPNVFVGGQNLRWTGSMGASGRQKIRLQFNFNRSGDPWNNVEGSGNTTDSAGRFDFNHPAPAAFGISYRVKSKKSVSSQVLLSAKSQESLVTVDATGAPAGAVIAGAPFDVEVDTTPRLGQRSDLPPPVFPGRRVDLQQRVSGNQWANVATGQTDGQGVVRFTLTAGSPGAAVYRARQDDYLSGGNQIGWHPSFPTYVRVLAPGAPRATLTGKRVRAASVVSQPVDSVGRAAKRGGSTNASARYKWNPARFDFAWEFGESLTSPPARGTKKRGGWIDSSNGTGRASHYNGGMQFDSLLGNAGGPGDRGTTSVQLRGNAQKYGRWEFRQRGFSLERNAQDYRVTIELVPESASPFTCVAQKVTVLDTVVNSRTMRYGVRAANKRAWNGQRKVNLGKVPHNFAVEVAKDHITWFLDGRPIGVVKNRKATSGVKLTPRLTLNGSDDREMNSTKVIYDWMRSFPIKKGKLVRKGPALTSGRHSGTC